MRVYQILISLIIGWSLASQDNHHQRYSEQLDGVEFKMNVLNTKIDKIESMAHTLGHSDIETLCQSAKKSLINASTDWSKIRLRYQSEPWKMSNSIQKTNVQDSLNHCGQTLLKIYENENLKGEWGDGYGLPIKECQDSYQSCQDACQSVWELEPPKPRPSSTNGHYKRQLNRRQVELSHLNQLCPMGETACPIKSNSGGGFECIDTQHELTNCGGCVSKSEGMNCMEIKGASGVGCMAGQCVVFSVQPGYSLSNHLDKNPS